MSALLRRFDTWWYAPAPADRLALVRVAVGGYALVYLLAMAKNFTRFSAHGFEGAGPVSLLAGPLPAAAVYAVYALTVLAGAAFTAGFRYRFTGPLFGVLLLWVTSYRSSFGMVFHTDNLLCLHALLVAVAPAADAVSLDAGTGGREEPAPHGRYGWALRAIAVVTVTTYALAGIAKVRASGLSWASGDVLRIQIAYDNLRKIELGSFHSPLGAALVPYGWLFPPLAAGSLALELGAPLALLSPRIARVWAAGAWAFHVGVLLLMAIAFPYPLSGVAYVAFFPVERVRSFVRAPRFLRKA